VCQLDSRRENEAEGVALDPGVEQGESAIQDR
jgi:hypothetical protein